MIRILSDEVVGKIAAGEVVERPASVVKELVENSIDAGADSIEIEVASAGSALIRVADNGVGLTSEDAKLICQRHATSKIRDIEDLDKVSTFGFRGEALSSIASVSQMDLISCVDPHDAGTYLYLESGQILKTKPAARPRGTTVEVRNLFYNVPARRKFLKKESTELAEIINTINHFLIAYPGIEFKFVHNNKCLLHAVRGTSVLSRIELMFGRDISEEIIEIPKYGDKYKVSGFVSRPGSNRKDRRAQVFFINKRFFRTRVLNEAVYDAYRSLMERGRYPAAILFVEAAPSDIDVNVHPAKLEVKFSDEKILKETVVGAIKNAFNCVKAVTASHIDDMGGLAQDVFPILPELQPEFSYNFRTSGDQAKGFVTGSRNLFQIAGCYIVQVNIDGVIVIDQHAAHERVLYEFFSSALEKKLAQSQDLLFPIHVELSAAETVVMEKAASNFRQIGFNIENFGERSLIIRSVPAILKLQDVKSVIMDVLRDISALSPSKIDVLDELVKLTSCRAAIKAGDLLSGEEMSALIDELDKCSMPFTCPHGRPTRWALTVEELEKKFRRK